MKKRKKKKKETTAMNKICWAPTFCVIFYLFVKDRWLCWGARYGWKGRNSMGGCGFRLGPPPRQQLTDSHLWQHPGEPATREAGGT